MSQAEGTSAKFGKATERVFTVYRFPPKMARKHINRIAKVIGPALGGIIESAAEETKQGGKAEDADVPLGRMIADALERLDLGYVEELMDACAAYTVCEPGGKLDTTYDAIFIGEPLTQYEWFWFALKVQFGDFFPALAADSNQIFRAIKVGQGHEYPST